MRPGFDSYDESHVLRLLQRQREGGLFPWDLFTGSLLLGLQRLTLFVTGPSVWALRAPVLLLLLLEVWALGRVAAKLWGPAAEEGAWLAWALSATTLMRARSLLAFAVLPAWGALLLWLLLAGPRWATALGGLLAGLLVLDYEAAPFLWGGLLLFVWAARVERARLLSALTGSALGLALALGLSQRSVATWWQARSVVDQAASQDWAELGRGAWDALWGLRGSAHLEVSAHLFAGLWAFALAALALRQNTRLTRGLALWALLGLTVLLLPSAQTGTHRAVAALPALSLLAALGWVRARDWAAARSWRKLCVGALLLAAAGLEAQAYFRSQTLADADHYGGGRNLQAAAQALAGRREQALTRLDEQSAAFRFLTGAPSNAPLRWLLVPPALGKDLPPDLTRGQVLRYNNPGQPALLLALPAEEAAAWTALDDRLGALEKSFAAHDPLHDEALLTAALLSGSFPEPAARAALWHQLLTSATGHGRLSQAQADDFLKDKTRSLYPLWPSALYAARFQPQLGRRLLDEALRREPRLAQSLGIKQP